ncbi:MAG: acyltransferase [Bacteroidetes bacterium]|nr:acyltransferase [Bacteroidota bacterium]
MKNTGFPSPKNHFEILDGLRGLAALTVVLFHLFETFTNTNHLVQIINHGYLAVDFFFLLSGYVIAYAYDDRWTDMTLGVFIKRRIIRLHPMILAGMLIGAGSYYIAADSELFPLISQTPVWKLLFVALLGAFMFPVGASLDIRGWGEMYPLNGPAWSLFYEYLANLLYALIFRHLSNLMLGILAVVAGIATVHYAVTSTTGDMVGGWSLDPTQLRTGITRLFYPFLAGLLLFRLFKPSEIRYAFAWSAFMLLLTLAFPRVGGGACLWLNGLYEALVILLVFPLIVHIGASGSIKSPGVLRICRFLGGISYPVYIIHYPIIYLYTAWVIDHQRSMSNSWLQGLAVFGFSITIAYICQKWYDVPFRKWLTLRFFSQ